MEKKQTADQILKSYEDDNEYHFHDVDREWIIKAMMEFATLSKMEIVYSDEDIVVASREKYKKFYEYEEGFIDGANWYRDKITQTI